MKIITVIGARPQIIKAAALSREVANNFSNEIHEIIVHTGQHYDQNMSQVFFSEMNISKPDYHLSIGSGSHGVQTSKMIAEIENILLKENPDYVVLYGDTNSTLAGSIAASKIHIPIIHIEAGLRSFNKNMPEEINRIICDHVSTLLFSPTKTGIHNLLNEGFDLNQDPPYSINNPGVFHCGDIMYDNSLYFDKIAEKKSNIIDKLSLIPRNYILGTIHRDYNTDNTKRLNTIFSSFHAISEKFGERIVLTLHPRTSQLIENKLNKSLKEKIYSSPLINLLPPVSFFDMIQLEKNAKLIMTDSGGVQKEAYCFKKPVVILIHETEGLEIVENKAGIVTDSNLKNILKAYLHFKENIIDDFPPVFGDGKAANFICNTIIRQFNK